jgi:hypothetical protein
VQRERECTHDNVDCDIDDLEHHDQHDRHDDNNHVAGGCSRNATA